MLGAISKAASASALAEETPIAWRVGRAGSVRQQGPSGCLSLRDDGWQHRIGQQHVMNVRIQYRCGRCPACSPGLDDKDMGGIDGCVAQAVRYNMGVQRENLLALHTRTD